MNDFTKEELQLILDKFSLLYFSQFEGCGQLAMKLQSMIDNYCEHETDAGGCGGDMIYRCKNCGFIIRPD